VGCGRFDCKRSRAAPALAVTGGFDDSANSNHDSLTRRSIFIGAAASLICAPAIVRVASLMPVHRLGGPIGPQYAGFCERLMYQSLDSNLRAGQMSTVLNGKKISEADARRMVAYARIQGWLLYVVRTFRTFGWQFKRVSGSSGLKVQAAIVC
jgi:hypothetical protein